MPHWPKLYKQGFPQGCWGRQLAEKVNGSVRAVQKPRGGAVCEPRMGGTSNPLVGEGSFEKSPKVCLCVRGGGTFLSSPTPIGKP